MTTRSPFPRQALPIIGALAIMLAAGLALTVATLTSATPAAANAQAQATPAPNIVRATEAQIPIIGVGAPGTLADPVNVYGGPDARTIIGPVEKGRNFTPVAVTQDGNWVQLDVLNSGLVWTPAANIHNLSTDGLAIIDAPPSVPVVDRVGTTPDGRTISVSAPSQEVADQVYRAAQSLPPDAQVTTAPDGTMTITCNGSGCSGDMSAYHLLSTLASTNGCTQANGVFDCNTKQAEPTPAPAPTAEPAAPASPLAPVVGHDDCWAVHTQAECDALAYKTFGASSEDRAQAVTDAFLDNSNAPTPAPAFVDAITNACNDPNVSKEPNKDKPNILAALCQ